MNEINKVEFEDEKSLRLEVFLRQFNSEKSESEELNLNRLGLSSLPSDWISNKNFKKLDLSSNNLKTIPDIVFEFLDLEILAISDNQIDTIPEKLSRLKKLKSIDLRNNSIETLPDNFGNNKDLRIDLSNNFFTELPELIKRNTLIVFNPQKLNLQKIKKLTNVFTIFVHPSLLKGLPPKYLQKDIFGNWYISNNHYMFLGTAVRFTNLNPGPFEDFLEQHKNLQSEKIISRENISSPWTNNHKRIFKRDSNYLIDPKKTPESYWINLPNNKKLRIDYLKDTVNLLAFSIDSKYLTVNINVQIAGDSFFESICNQAEGFFPSHFITPELLPQKFQISSENGEETRFTGFRENNSSDLSYEMRVEVFYTIWPEENNILISCLYFSTDRP